MSVLGTGIAAGVAQTQLQAGQVNTQRRRAYQQIADQQRRLQRGVPSSALADSEESGHSVEPVDQLTIDGHMPQHQQAGPNADLTTHGTSSERPAQTDSSNVEPLERFEAGDTSTLYRHLDVQA